MSACGPQVLGGRLGGHWRNEHRHHEHALRACISPAARLRASFLAGPTSAQTSLAGSNAVWFTGDMVYIGSGPCSTSLWLSVYLAGVVIDCPPPIPTP